MVSASGKDTEWQTSGVFRLEVEEDHIRADFFVQLLIRSTRSYHASSGDDDTVTFRYSVLTKRT